MSEDIVQTLIHLVGVTLGLFVLWSLIGGMRKVPVAARFGYALTAGVISAVVVFGFRIYT